MISVPFQIGALPIETPIPQASHVGCLGDWMLNRLVTLAESRSDFKNHNALVGESVSQIKFLPKVRPRAAPFYKGAHKSFDSLPLRFA